MRRVVDNARHIFHNARHIFQNMRNTVHDMRRIVDNARHVEHLARTELKDNSMNIEQCFKKVSANDCAESFRTIYNHYYGRLFQQALYYLNNNPDSAQEVVSDVFVALWQSRRRLANVARPDAYLFIALKHAAARHVEKNVREKHELRMENLPDIRTDDRQSDTRLIDAELQARYREALLRLPPQCARIFRLVREEKKTYAQAAAMLGLSPKTVDNQMNKAVKLLYAQLKDLLHLLWLCAWL
jgi:RNA polymerase sigma-70 factor (ECF subfamily)